MRAIGKNASDHCLNKDLLKAEVQGDIDLSIAKMVELGREDEKVIKAARLDISRDEKTTTSQLRATHSLTINKQLQTPQRRSITSSTKEEGLANRPKSILKSTTAHQTVKTNTSRSRSKQKVQFSKKKAIYRYEKTEDEDKKEIKRQSSPFVDDYELSSGDDRF